MVYEHRQDAEKALDQYNNVALDGKPMRISFASGGTQLTSGIRYAMQCQLSLKQSKKSCRAVMTT